MSVITKIFGTHSQREIKRIIPIVNKIEALADKYSAMSDAELKAQTPYFKALLAEGKTLDDILPEAFATMREACWRVLEKRPYRVQLIGGIVIHQGRIAEMKTGEGKTIVATLPAYLNALNGNGVHVVTVNDYLAKFQSEWMGKVYNFLGLSVGLIVQGLDNESRRKAYAADITYGTNNEFGFDYLRDNMVIYKENMVQRGHAFAIVDEVDSILIDEARTPLIISGQGEASTMLYEKANILAKSLKCFKVKEADDKSFDDELNSDADYIVDEKAKSATLTQRGIEKAESFFNLENLADPENADILHHIDQAIRAHGIMHIDDDYVVKDGEIVIVDSFTGRLMPGRRYNNGLHQAIEAKEGVKVRNESKTLATITFQNYFRMYKKLSGMTGTAVTEEDEFREIYNLDVVEIPTNLPMIRVDYPDKVYTTEAAKYRAIIARIKEAHEIGQPVLVGTASIEKSELLSRMLSREGIKHNVLNAKQHEREAEIVAQAGRFGSVTISTNMAGRGTDIMLGGNSEYLAKQQLKKMGYPDELVALSDSYFDTEDEEILKIREEFKKYNEKYKEEILPEANKVKEAGGLLIIGTERHESRRIDNQLRGRSGRQGDVGASIFYLSTEDDLMRIFGGDRMRMIMNSLKVPEDEPIDSKMITNVIENAQKRLEGNNFGRRKNVLMYDDVMNQQRTLIYEQRKEVLDGKDLHGKILGMLDKLIDETVDTFCADDNPENWNLASLRNEFLGTITTPEDLVYDKATLSKLKVEDIKKELTEKGHEKYEAKDSLFPEGAFREIERVILLRNVDSKWMDHIDAMDDLIEGINLHSYGQRSPIVEYKIEGADMFDRMIASIREDTVKQLLSVVPREQKIERKQVANITSARHGGESEPAAQRPIVKKGKKVGVNDPCPCGSGKKYKKCCMLKEGQK